ncbi:MAG: hypothetical protein V1724_02245 [Chloroflexota bacterium]
MVGLCGQCSNFLRPDLAQSIGNASQAEVRRVMNEVVPKIKAAGKWVGVGGNSPSDVARVVELIRLGATFVTIGALALTRLAAENFRKQVAAAL